MTALFETPKMKAPVYNITAQAPGGGTPAPSPPPLPAPTASSSSVQAVGQDVAAAQSQAAGRASTILTGGQGVMTPAETIKSQLLGA